MTIRASTPNMPSIYLPIEATRAEKFQVFYSHYGRENEYVAIEAVKFGSLVFKTAADAYEYLSALTLVPVDTDVDAASEALADWAQDAVRFNENTARH